MRVHARYATVLSLALATFAGCASVPPSSRPTPRDLMVVVSKGLPGLTVYDASNDQPVCQVKLGVAPHEAAFSADGRTLYVPIYSSANIGQPGPDGHSIEFIRSSDCQVVATLDTGRYKRPHYVERGMRSGRLYVTAEQDASVLVIDPERRAIVDVLPTGSHNTHFFALTRDESRLFTSNVGDGTLSVVDVPRRQLLRQVDAKPSNQRLTLSPDERWFVTSLWQSGKVAFHRTSDGALDFEVPVDGAPFVARFSPDGRHLYDMGMPPPGAPPGIRVWKIDVATRKVVATSVDPLGSGTGSLQVSPVNGQLYLTAYSGQVHVLDPVTLRRLRSLDAADTPDGLFFGRQR